MTKKALVLGAGGFIGSHMVKRLKSDGYWVRGVDLKRPEFSSTYADEFIQGDLREADFVRKCLQYKGTGGDGANTFNISTAVSFVASSCGVNIAKHGNRSASGKVGSADVLSNLGINLNSPLKKVISCMDEIGITFLFAPAWHKSLINLAPLRKQLGIRTVFNQLGPLVNPLRPNAQVLGVATEDLLSPMASALNIMGMDRAIVVYGYGGLDEASLEGDNKIIFVDKGNLKHSKINVSDFNYKNTSNKDLIVSKDDYYEDILKSVLNGSGQKAHIDVVALNTALVLWVARIEDNIEIGFNKALRSMSEAKPWDKFLLLKNYLNS